MTHPRHEDARRAMATRLARFFYDNRFDSDWVALAGDRFWTKVPRTAGEKHTPSPETRHLTLEYLRDLEAKQAARGPSLEEIAEARDTSSWSAPASDTVSDGSIVPTPNNDARASHSSVLGPSDSSEAPAGGTAANREGEGLNPSSQTLAAVSEDVCPPAGLNLSETQRGEQASFDLKAARAARDDGMSKVAERDPSWNLRALQAVRRLAERTPTFIVDDVWKELGEPEPENGRVMGPVMLSAAKQGIIAKTDDYLPSARVTAHGNPRRVWRSLLCEASVSA